MEIKLVFEDWHQNNKSIYNTPEGIELSLGDFHSGTTFDGEIRLNKENKLELKNAIKKGYIPIFRIIIDQTI